MSMIIKNVESRHYVLPLNHAMADATHDVHTCFEVVLVVLETECGLRGCGYTYTIGRGGTAIQSLIQRELKPLLLNADANRIDTIWEQMWCDCTMLAAAGCLCHAGS